MQNEELLVYLHTYYGTFHIAKRIQGGIKTLCGQIREYRDKGFTWRAATYEDVSTCKTCLRINSMPKKTIDTRPKDFDNPNVRFDPISLRTLGRDLYTMQKFPETWSLKTKISLVEKHLKEVKEYVSAMEQAFKNVKFKYEEAKLKKAKNKKPKETSLTIYQTISDDGILRLATKPMSEAPSGAHYRKRNIFKFRVLYLNKEAIIYKNVSNWKLSCLGTNSKDDCGTNFKTDEDAMRWLTSKKHCKEILYRGNYCLVCT